jgi:transcriptional regulator with XRE-family HTH domain
MPKIDSWAARVTRSVAWQVHRHRKALGWSAQKLSDACAELGLEFPRSTLADLESGRRAHVSVAELLVLARALDVPPLLLLFPVGAEEETEVLPGEPRPSFRAAQWFAGAGPYPAEGDAGVVTGVTAENAGAAAPLVLYREHDRFYEAEIIALEEAMDADDRAAAGGPDARTLAAGAAALRQMAAGYRAQQERLRDQARALGIKPPDPVRRGMVTS